MVKNIIHNALFRLITPLLYGVVMYVLILLVFDSIQQLSENFFSIEVFLCVVITFLIFETIRLYIIILEKKCPEGCNLRFRILLQGSGSVVLAFLLTSFIISFYFKKLVGFNTFKTELIVFNAIFILSGILYNMFYFSFFYLNRKNVSELERENINRKNTEIELDIYKNKINPGFLYDSLESLISISKKNNEEADSFIQKLSDVYRNILSTKNSELCAVEEEINVVKNLIEIFNYKLDGNLNLSIKGQKDFDRFQIIKGTLTVIIEDIVNRSIISKIQPLEVKVKLENNELKIYHNLQNKLVQIFSKRNELNHLNKGYLKFGDKGLQVSEAENIRMYIFPVYMIEN